MFIKPFVSEDRSKKALEKGRSVEIKLTNGTRVDGQVEFIAECHGAHSIFVDAGLGRRDIIKIYSNRTLVELITYKEDTINAVAIEGITVTSSRKQEILITSRPGELYYFTDEKVNKDVPVVVGDKFFKHDKEFTVLAISRNGGTMFLEDEKGTGITVSLNDKTLIETFRGFKWGNPTK